MGDLTRSFSRYEFACKCNCGADDINMALVSRLQSVRDVLGSPIVINSGVRCAEHNKAVGGVSDSEHLTGEAADLKCQDSSTRHLLLYYVHEKFTRIGIDKKFIHVGVSSNKAQEVTWMY